jgi:hypothetical protein
MDHLITIVQFFLHLIVPLLSPLAGFVLLFIVGLLLGLWTPVPGCFALAIGAAAVDMAPAAIIATITVRIAIILAILEFVLARIDHQPRTYWSLTR